MNIILSGFMGCGKTTIGKIIARKLDLDFIDTDKLIEEREGRKIRGIFDTDGEGYFRDKEHEICAELSREDNKVIATGGGAILRQDNREALKSNAFVCFLDRSLDLIQPTDDRPLSRDRAALTQRYREREALYRATADVRIDADGTAQAVATAVEKEFLR